MKALLLVAAACLALTLVPAASAGPVCAAGVCVSHVASGGTVGVCETDWATFGTCAGAHVGTDATYVYFGQGITHCVWGADIRDVQPIDHCAF